MSDQVQKLGNFPDQLLDRQIEEITSGVNRLTKIKQIQLVSTAACSTMTTTVPGDDTIPQNNEGTELLTLAFTPKSSSSNLLFEVVVPFASSAANPNIVGAIFVDTTASALLVGTQTVIVADYVDTLKFSGVISAGSISARTYKLRVGPTLTATVTINGYSGTRLLGGALSAFMRITEYA